MHFIEFSSSRDTNSFALISEQSDDYFSLPLDQDDLPNTRGPTFFPPYNLTVPDGGSQVNHSLMAEYPIEQYSPRNHVTSVDSDSQPIDMFLSLPSLDEGSNLSDLRLFPYASSLFEPTGVHYVQRRFSEYGELCRSRLKDTKHSFNRCLSTSKLQRIRKMPIRHDLAFGDVYPCESDQECFFIFSKRRADLISGTELSGSEQ